MSNPSRTGRTEHHTERLDASAVLGSFALFGSAMIFLLAAIDRNASLSFMPGSWYSHRSLWYLLAFGGLIAAFALLRPKDADRRREQLQSGRETSHSPVFQTVTLYTRSGCHLCDDAKVLLAEFATDLPPVQELDIDADPQLAERFTECVPVVEIDGKIRFRGKVNPVLLRRLIDAGSRRQDTDEVA